MVPRVAPDGVSLLLGTRPILAAGSIARVAPGARGIPIPLIIPRYTVHSQHRIARSGIEQIAGCIFAQIRASPLPSYLL